MFLHIHLASEVLTYDLDKLAECYSGIITIGKKTKEVWNAIALENDTIDPFQCHLIGSVGGYWRLNRGQKRTECPKGLISSKTVPCNGCMGRCVNIHAGRPKYLDRIPQVPVLVNDKEVGQFGIVLNPGDKITFGDVICLISETNKPN